MFCGECSGGVVRERVWIFVRRRERMASRAKFCTESSHHAKLWFRMTSKRICGQRTLWDDRSELASVPQSTVNEGPGSNLDERDHVVALTEIHCSQVQTFRRMGNGSSLLSSVESTIEITLLKINQRRRYMYYKTWLPSLLISRSYTYHTCTNI